MYPALDIRIYIYIELRSTLIYKNKIVTKYLCKLLYVYTLCLHYFRFKRTSNAFMGTDETLLFKALFSIRTWIGIGVFISTFLPWRLSAALASILLLPAIVRTLLVSNKFIEDEAAKAHPVLKGDYTAALKGDFCLFLIGARSNTMLPAKEFKWLGEMFSNMLKELEAAPKELGMYIYMYT